MLQRSNLANSTANSCWSRCLNREATLQIAREVSNFFGYCIYPVKYLYQTTHSLLIEKCRSSHTRLPQSATDNAGSLQVATSSLRRRITKAKGEETKAAEEITFETINTTFSPSVRAPSILRQELVLNVPQDQKDLLSNVKEEELKAIKECYNHPEIPQVTAWIKSGQWLNFIDFVRQKPNYYPIYSLLKAAYCQGALGEKDPSTEGIDNLVTAYNFLAPLKNEQNFRLFHFEEIQKEAHLWDETSTRWEIAQIPENQRYFILVERSSMSEEAIHLTGALFNLEDKTNYVAGGISYYKPKPEEFYKTGLRADGWALGSAAIIRQDNLLKGYAPIFGRGLRPIEARFTNLLRGGLDFALCEPNDIRPKEVHGATTKGQANLVIMHDGFHALTTVRRKVFKHPKVLEIGLKANLLLRKKAVPPYSENARVIVYSFYNFLEGEELTENDWIRFFLDETILAIQDGEGETVFAEDSGWSSEEIFVQSIDAIVRRQRLYHPSNKTPPSYERLVILFNQYLEKPLGITFFTKGHYLTTQNPKNDEDL